MIEGLIPLLALLLVFVIIFFVITKVVAYFEGPAIITQVVGLILLLIWLVRALMIFGVKLP